MQRWAAGSAAAQSVHHGEISMPAPPYRLAWLGVIETVV